VAEIYTGKHYGHKPQKLKRPLSAEL